MLEVAKVHVLRHKVLVEGFSQREVARELGVGRNTITKYLGEPEPRRKASGPRPRPVREKAEAAIVKLLEDSRSRTTKKQKLTSPRVVELLGEQGITVSPRTVRRVMSEWSRQRREVSVPLHYVAGDLAEVDFFEVQVDVDGKRRKAWMFVMRLMYSGRDFAWVYAHQDQACFLDGHVRAFEHFGAVPNRIVYDNLKAAVRRLLVGSERDLQVRFCALASHYLFEPNFARPRRGNDKGGVEARGKGVRWQHLSPIPEAVSLQACSEQLLARLDERGMARPRRRGGPTVAELWVQEPAAMLQLPAHPFLAGVQSFTSASRSQAKVRVKTAWYSTPSTWASLQVEAWLLADKVVLLHDGERVEHPRQPANGESIFYRHYLRELACKPQALRQVAGPLMAELGTPFDRLWRDLVDERGPLGAARAYKVVLAAIVEQGEDQVRGVIARAIDKGESPVLALRPQQEPAPPITVPEHLRQHRVAGSDLGLYSQVLGGLN